MSASTISLVPARHTWPPSSYIRAARAAASSRSASSKTRSGPLPPSSPVKGTGVIGRLGPADRACGVRRSGKRDSPSQSARDERSPDVLADPLDDVENSRRETRLSRQVGQERARERRPLGRLQDHRAPGGQRGCGLPSRKHEWRVPRRDDHSGPRRHADHGVVSCRSIPDPLLVGGGELGVHPVVSHAPGGSPLIAGTRAPRPCPRTRRGRCARRSRRSAPPAASAARVSPAARGRPRLGTPRLPPRAPLAPRHRLLAVRSRERGRRSGSDPRTSWPKRLARPPIQCPVETWTPATSAELGAHSSVRVSRSSTE